MSTTPQHAYHTFLIAFLVAHLSPWIAVALGVVGGWNDLAAYPEHIRAMLRARSNGDPYWLSARDYDGQYRFWHTFRWWYFLLPPLLLHWVIDRLTHDPVSGGWRPFAIQVEIAFWAICLAFTYLIWHGWLP
jgi:hypothetical protein